MREAPRNEERPEFDAYAREYAELIRDPIREKFATDNRYFFERKAHVIRSFYKNIGIDTRTLRWLDVGCGQGDLMRLLSPFFGAAAGCDPSGEMLQASRDLDVRPQPVADKVPFGDASFDLVTAVCVYHHVPCSERPALTREILRVLRPGGIFAMIEHNPVNPATRLIVSRTPVDAHAKLLRASEWQQLMASAGARHMSTRYFLYVPEGLHKYLGFIEDGLAWFPLGGQYSVFGNAVK